MSTLFRTRSFISLKPFFLIMAVLICRAGFAQLVCGDQMSGSPVLIPYNPPVINADGSTYTLLNPNPNAMDYTWYANTDVIPATQVSGSGTSCTYNLSNTDTRCKIPISCYFKVNGVEYCQRKDVRVLPLIKTAVPVGSPSGFYPPIYIGVPCTFFLQDNCNGTPFPGTGYTYSWTPSNANICASPCTNTNSTYTVNISPSLASIPQSVTMNCTVSASTSTESISGALRPVTLPVALKGPSVTGPATVGCPGNPSTSATLTYTTPPIPGATGYDWIVNPAYFTVLSGLGTNTITVSTVQSSGSQLVPISVRAKLISGNNNFYSDYSTISVKICCASNLTINTPVINAPAFNKEAGTGIEMLSSIDGTSDAKIHAGVEVKLSPGFHAMSGSKAHLYIEGCTSWFVKTAKDHGETGQPAAVNDPFQEPARPVIEEAEAEARVDVFPNPNNGRFTVIANSSQKRSVSVYDAFGKLVFDLPPTWAQKVEVDISSHPKGIYIIRVTEGRQQFSTRIIRQ